MRLSHHKLRACTTPPKLAERKTVRFRTRLDESDVALIVRLSVALIVRLSLTARSIAIACVPAERKQPSGASALKPSQVTLLIHTIIVGLQCAYK